MPDVSEVDARVVGVLVDCDAADCDEVAAIDAVDDDPVAVVSPSVWTPDVPEQPATSALTASSPAATIARFRIPAPSD